MTDDSDDSDDSENRPTDWLAINHGGLAFHHGLGATEDQAIDACLQYAGPWEDDRDEPVEVGVWKLLADSWQSFRPTGPERGAEQVGHRVWAIPVEEARKIQSLAADLDRATDRALGEAEITREDGDLD